ncbi:hypothetical protein B0T14DRAFT_275811 [Immersiella caudata]|uniref:Uncharacterized protein n=1 Tax=Immersiella caudata TaxID=314043 RepID=A0AA40BTM9_9PEZI|nr:hypothetical protein B0T14DRAFT_275811 [Immersiella caudata]
MRPRNPQGAARNPITAAEIPQLSRCASRHLRHRTDPSQHGLGMLLRRAMGAQPCQSAQMAKIPIWASLELQAIAKEYVAPTLFPLSKPGGRIIFGRGHVKDSMVHILDVQVVHLGSDPTGALSGGYVTLSGPFLAIVPHSTVDPNPGGIQHIIFFRVSPESEALRRLYWVPDSDGLAASVKAEDRIFHHSENGRFRCLEPHQMHALDVIDQDRNGEGSSHHCYHSLRHEDETRGTSRCLLDSMRASGTAEWTIAFINFVACPLFRRAVSSLITKKQCQRNSVNWDYLNQQMDGFVQMFAP